MSKSTTNVKKWAPEPISLAKSGQIKHIGISNHNLEEIKLANSILAKEGVKISAVQNHFSLMHRASEESEILNYSKENEIVFFAYMAIGVTNIEQVDDAATIEDITQQVNISTVLEWESTMA